MSSKQMGQSSVTLMSEPETAAPSVLDEVCAGNNAVTLSILNAEDPRTYVRNHLAAVLGHCNPTLSAIQIIVEAFALENTLWAQVEGDLLLYADGPTLFDRLLNAMDALAARARTRYHL